MMEEINIFMGIDVSKESLDISVNNKPYTLKNTSVSITKFIKTTLFPLVNEIKLCVLESTGGYEILVMKLLQKAHIPVHRVHPNKIYAFAKVKGHFAKTDKLDARLLEHYARFVFPQEQGDDCLSKRFEALKMLRSVEIDIQKTLAAHKNRLHHLKGKALGYLKNR